MSMSTDHPINTDTIVAIATSPGRGSIGVTRLSGPEALIIAGKICKGVTFKPRKATYQSFRDHEGHILDQGIVIYFQAPHSFTGEEVVELQGHGGPAVLNALLKCTLALGARLAKPGEFSERAFCNGRLDLTQAEAIADLINATSEQAARSAIRSLQGEFSQKVSDIHALLIKLRTYVEASIDFSEEDIEFLSIHQVNEDLKELLQAIQLLRTSAEQGHRLQEGIHLVIAGPPNAGKSSLLNALIGQDKAIVTPISGTTRDVLHAEMNLDGLPLHIIDTAGLRLTEDIIEQEGIKRALAEINRADQVLWVVDSTVTQTAESPFTVLKLLNHPAIKSPVALIRNKIDLTQEVAGRMPDESYDILQVSSKTGEGLDQLKTYLKERVGYDAAFTGCSARERHIDALMKAEQRLKQAIEDWTVDSILEILAFNLHEIQQMLAVITGKITSDDLLGRIFSQFCIGK